MDGAPREADRLCGVTLAQEASRPAQPVPRIEAAEPKRPTSSDRAQWRQFVLETAGAWQGELERPEQGDYEQRDELP